MKARAASFRKGLKWFQNRCNLTLSTAARFIEVVDHRNQAVAMAAFDAWTENACEGHMAIDVPIAARPLMSAAFSYVFLEANKGVIFGKVPQSHVRSWQVAFGLGFRLVAREKDGWGVGDDLLVLGLRKEDCRYIRPKERKAA